MLLKKITTEVKEDLVEIKLPYYCMGENNNYYKISSAENALRVSDNLSISKIPVWLWEKEIAASVEISDVQFQDVYDRTLSIITNSSLEPALP